MALAKGARALGPTGFEYVGKQMEASLEAVSYTHLDVYKRQVQSTWVLPQRTRAEPSA